MSFLFYNLYHFIGNLHEPQGQFNFARKCQGTVREGQKHESNDMLLNDEFSRWDLRDNFLPEVTHLFLPKLCLRLSSLPCVDVWDGERGKAKYPEKNFLFK